MRKSLLEPQGKRGKLNPKSGKGFDKRVRGILEKEFPGLTKELEDIEARITGALGRFHAAEKPADGGKVVMSKKTKKPKFSDVAKAYEERFNVEVDHKLPKTKRDEAGQTLGNALLDPVNPQSPLVSALTNRTALPGEPLGALPARFGDEHLRAEEEALATAMTLAEKRRLVLEDEKKMRLKRCEAFGHNWFIDYAGDVVCRRCSARGKIVQEVGGTGECHESFERDE